MGNRIVYKDYAVGASEYATVNLAESDHQTKLVSGVPVDLYYADFMFTETLNDYVSFDTNGIDVTDSIRLFTDSDHYGFVSDCISNSDRGFTANPKLVIDFESNGSARVIDGNGIALYFSEHFCTRVKVRYKLSSNTYTDAESYTINSMYAYLPKTVQGYKKVEIEFVETELPYQYVKVKKVEFGKTYTIDKIKSISYNKKIDFFCSDIPINTLDVSFVFEENLNFYTNQKLLVYHNAELIGTYWIADIDNVTDKLYNITAEDVFSRLEMTIADPVFASLSDAVTIGDVLGSYEPLIHVDAEASYYAQGFFKKDTLRKLVADSMIAYGLMAKPTANGTVVLYKDEPNETVCTIDGTKIIGDAIYKSTAPITSIEYRSKKYNDDIYLSDPDDTISYNTTVGTTWQWYDLEYPAKSVGMNDQSGQPIDVYDYDTGQFQYLYDVSNRFHVGIRSTSQTFVNVNVVVNPCDNVEITYSETRDTSVGRDSTLKSFGTRSFYVIGAGAETWLEKLKKRTFSVIGEVRAKAILSYDKEVDNTVVTRYLDVGDYVDIETKHSGTLRGTITEIDADIGNRDIVGNVVITIWENSLTQS